MLRLMLSIAVLALVSMACTSAREPASSNGASSSPSASEPDGGPSGGTGNLTPAIVDPIVADAAAHAGVPASEVTVVSAEPVTWPDGGLGCPLPGMVYPQVIVDGYQVIVQVGQQTFDYRGSSAGKFRLCTTPA